MHHFPSCIPLHDSTLGRYVNAAFIDSNWQFQNSLDLSKRCVVPLSPLGQVFYSPACTGIFKEYEYGKEEINKFYNQNSFLIPNFVIAEAMQPLLPAHLFIDNLIEQAGDDFLFPSGKIGSDLCALDGTGNSRKIFQFTSPISQIHSIGQDLISIRLYNSIHLLKRSCGNFATVGSFNKMEPSKLASCAPSTDELMISSANGTLAFFSLSTSKISTIKFESPEYFTATYGNGPNVLLWCSGFQNLSLADRRFKRSTCRICPDIFDNSLISNFQFWNDRFILASSVNFSVFFDVRMLNRPALIDKNAGGSLFAKFKSINPDEQHLICYNEKNDSLKINFYNLQNDSASVDAPPCQLLHVNHGERKLRGISRLPSEDGNLVHLYDDGSLFMQKLSISSYSTDYVSKMQLNDQIIFNEPFITKDANEFSPLKPFHCFNCPKTKALLKAKSLISSTADTIDIFTDCSDAVEQITGQNQALAYLAQLWDSNEPNLPLTSSVDNFPEKRNLSERVHEPFQEPRIIKPSQARFSFESFEEQCIVASSQEPPKFKSFEEQPVVASSQEKSAVKSAKLISTQRTIASSSKPASATGKPRSQRKPGF